MEGLITQAGTTTVPAVMSYDFFFGQTPRSDGVDYLAGYAGGLPAQGFSTLNTWVNLGATFAATSGFESEYGAVSRTQFVDTIYPLIMGHAPTNASAVPTLVGSMDFYAAYAGSEIGARGAVAGVLLYCASQDPTTPYAQAMTHFLQDAGSGTATYQTPLIGTYLAG